MAKHKHKRNATDTASYRINATNPDSLNAQNASAGGAPSPEAAARQAQQQIQSGKDPEEAVSSVLGPTARGGGAAAQTAGAGAQGGGGAAQGAGEAIEALFEQAADMDVTKQVQQAAQQTGNQAQTLGSRIADAARGFAMEIGEALGLGGGRNGQKGKNDQQDENDKI